MAIFLFLIIGVILFYICRFFVRASKEGDAKWRKELEEKAAWEQKLKLFQRQTPTASNGNIRGRKITRQIKMIAVDNHRTQEDAERAFFSEVRACGAQGVINMKVRRQRGGFVSIQGDAVALE